MEIIFLSAARQDVRDAYHWYEKQNRGLGKKFLEEVILFSQRLKRECIEYTRYIKNIRYVKLLLFPYSMFFKKTRCIQILILAVLHNRRNVAEILSRRS